MCVKCVNAPKLAACWILPNRVWLFGMRGARAMDKFKGKVGKSRATVRVISVASREQPVACPASGLLTSLPPPCTAEHPGAGWGVLIGGEGGRNRGGGGGGGGERNALGGRA
jgi:hypothetical protein